MTPPIPVANGSNYCGAHPSRSRRILLLNPPADDPDCGEFVVHDASAVRNCSRRLPVAQPERRPGASRGSVADRRRRRVPPLGLPDSRATGVPQEAGSARSRPRSPCRPPVTTLPFRWSPGADAGTHSLRTPTPSHSAGGHWGPALGPSHSPTASSTSSVRALIGRVGGTGPWADPSHFPAASASSPPNVVSSCSTISACFFSLRVTLAANTAAEATMIARGT